MCHFYGWTLNECLDLPIKAFNQLYKEACKIDALEHRELLDIAAVPSYSIEYYKELRAKYNRMIFPGPKKLPEKPAAMYLPSSSPDRKDIVLGLFRAVKRGMGYG